MGLGELRQPLLHAEDADPRSVVAIKMMIEERYAYALPHGTPYGVVFRGRSGPKALLLCGVAFACKPEVGVDRMPTGIKFAARDWSKSGPAPAGLFILGEPRVAWFLPNPKCPGAALAGVLKQYPTQRPSTAGAWDTRAFVTRLLAGRVAANYTPWVAQVSARMGPLEVVVDLPDAGKRAKFLRGTVEVAWRGQPLTEPGHLGVGLMVKVEVAKRGRVVINPKDGVYALAIGQVRAMLEVLVDMGVAAPAEHRKDKTYLYKAVQTALGRCNGIAMDRRAADGCAGAEAHGLLCEFGLQTGIITPGDALWCLLNNMTGLDAKAAEFRLELDRQVLASGVPWTYVLQTLVTVRQVEKLKDELCSLCQEASCALPAGWGISAAGDDGNLWFPDAWRGRYVETFGGPRPRNIHLYRYMFMVNNDGLFGSARDALVLTGGMVDIIARSGEEMGLTVEPEDYVVDIAHGVPWAGCMLIMDAAESVYAPKLRDKFLRKAGIVVLNEFAPRFVARRLAARVRSLYDNVHHEGRIWPGMHGAYFEFVARAKQLGATPKVRPVFMGDELFQKEHVAKVKAPWAPGPEHLWQPYMLELLSRAWRMPAAELIEMEMSWSAARPY